MKYPGTNIRIAVYEALGDVTINGLAVPVFDELASPDASFPRIMLLDITGGGARSSKCGFGNDWNQTIKVTTSFKGRVTKNIGEDISNQILNRLVPVSGDFLDIGPDFNVWKVEGSVVNTSSYTDGIRTYIDNNIRITYSLTEK